MPVLGLFLSLLVFFHTTEFLLAVVFQRQDLSFSSTLLSRGYVAAMSVAVLEHVLEIRLLPELKSSAAAQALSATGLALAVCGEALRKAAILGARHNFTHRVQFERRSDHCLITTGVYGRVRHPGYLGFLLWAAGTQLLLANPLCLVLFIAVVWVFFRRRIHVEEQQLLRFFGPAYAAYRQRVPCGIPFVF